MGCMTTVSRVLMVVINLLSMIIGLGILASGVMLLVADKFVEKDLDKLLERTEDIGNGAGIVNPAATPEDKDKIIKEVFDVAMVVGIIFCVLGGIIFLMSLMGCIGGCCMAKCALIFYAILAFIVLIAIAALAGVFFSGAFNDDVKDEFKDMIKDDYGGFDTFEPKSLLLNYIMIEGKCCGIDGSKDFINATKWRNVREFNNTDGTGVVNMTLEAPVACCVMTGKFPEVAPKDKKCAIEPHANITYIDNGCWSSISEDLEDYRLGGIVVCVAVVVFFFILAMLSIFLFTQTRK